MNNPQMPTQGGPPPGYSDKPWTTALILSVLTGSLGIDRFYLGYTGLGIAKLLTCGGCGIWSIIDIVMLATDKLPDAQGRPLPH
ncbi:MAG: TM2 domain-containing protein [Chloroflexota bacterium]|nr:TM2 domain-containing protein [Chloroflexota bacterium]